MTPFVRAISSARGQSNNHARQLAHANTEGAVPESALVVRKGGDTANLTSAHHPSKAIKIPSGGKSAEAGPSSGDSPDDDDDDDDEGESDPSSERVTAPELLVSAGSQPSL